MVADWCDPTQRRFLVVVFGDESYFPVSEIVIENVCDSNTYVGEESIISFLN